MVVQGAELSCTLTSDGCVRRWDKKYRTVESKEKELKCYGFTQKDGRSVAT